VSVPVYGPTEPFGLDEPQPFIEVHVAYLLTRQQLLTALEAGYTEIAAERTTDSLTNAEIRTEVEHTLAASGVIDLDRLMQRADGGEGSGWRAGLEACIDRAYPAPAAPPAALPSGTEGTVTLATADHGDVTLPEPSWCRGHGDHSPTVHRCDLTHYGTETLLTHQGAELFRVMVTESPFATRPEHRGVVAYVEQASYTGDFTPASLYDLAATLDGHADRLRDFADQLGRLLDGGHE
jgi:hypothetical protein